MTETVLVTGVSGFIARYVSLALLRGGYSVRGTVRDASKGETVRNGLAPHDKAAADPARLSFVAADLTRDDGWKEAVNGASAVMHVASPFPMAQPKDRNALTPAARDGALRVIDAALGAGAQRIVMTASMVTMMYRPNRPAEMTVGENDWTDLAWNKLSAYVVSKTEAEKAAWNRVEERGAKARFTTIHPGFVLGPALDKDFGTSIELMRMIMTGAYPAMPPVAYPIVDVRDVADLHVAALKRPATGGRRLIAANGVLSMAELAAAVKKAEPEKARKAPTATLPGFLVSALAAFDRNLAAVIPDLGTRPSPDWGYVAELTGLKFRSPAEAAAATAKSLARLGVV
jgi:dihydroflavonol-4-reductase